MKTENLSIGLRVLYHAIEWLTVFLILLIFAVQIITPLYAVRVGRADSFLQQLQWLPYRPGVLALGVMLAAVGTILSKCSHEVDSGFLSRSSWQLYLLEGVLYSASALIFQQNCDKIALFAIVDMVDDPRSLRQKRFLSAMIVVYLFCNMDAATSALHAVTLKQYLAFYSLHTRSVLQLVIESLSALEMILFILYMVLFISQQTSEKQEILNLNQQLQQAMAQIQQMAAVIDQQNGSNLSEQAGAAAAAMTGGGGGGETSAKTVTNSLGGQVGGGTNPLATKAAERAMNINNPNK